LHANAFALGDPALTRSPRRPVPAPVACPVGAVDAGCLGWGVL